MSERTDTQPVPAREQPRPAGSPQVVALVRALAATGGRAAAQRIAPLIFGIGVTATVLFAGQGMDARDLVSLCQRSRAVRAELWGLWLLAATPAARALLGERSALFWRSLPVPRWQHYAVTAGLMMLLELPMSILYGRAGGVLAGLAMTLYAVAAHSVLCNDGRSARTWALAAGLAAALLLPHAPEHSVALWPAATLLAGCALPAAWRRAAARPLPLERPMVRGPATPALLLGHLAVVVRTQRPLLARAGLYYLIALAVGWLALRNNHIDAPAATAALSLLALSPCALLAAGALAGPVLQGERTLGWLLRSSGVTGTQQIAASHGAVMALTAPMALLYGALMAGVRHASLPLALRLLAESLLCTLAAASAVTALFRWAQRGDPRDGDRILMVQLALVPTALLAAWALQELALLLLLLAGAVLWGVALSLAAPMTRHGRLRRERADRNSNQVSS